MPLKLTERDGAVSFSVHVKPRSSKDEVVGLHGDALSVRITAPPVDGAANEALRKLFSKLLKVPTSSVEIIAGQTGKSKIFRILGATAQDILALLTE